MKLLIIGDLHLSTNDKASWSPLETEPDLIVCVGDVIDAGTDPDSGREYLATLAREVAPVLYVPGNHDRTVQKELTREKNVWNIEQDSIVESGYRFVGFGSDQFNDGPEFPYHTVEQLVESPELLSQWARSTVEDGTSEIQIEEAERLRPSLKRYRNRLETLRNLLKKENKPTVLVTHVPPFDTDLDIIKEEHSPFKGLHWGSLAVRHAIESTDVVACVSGHIHHSAGTADVDECLVMNPGFRTARFVELIENTATPLDETFTFTVQ